MTHKPNLQSLGEQWKTARTLYPLYAALAREFVIEMPPCGDLESNIDAPPEESILQAEEWFLEMDPRIQVHQLRQFLQTTALSTDDGVRALLMHHLGKADRNEMDRDKLDFLLVQYFSNCAPSRLEDSDVDLEYVAQMLEPVLGAVDLTVPDWLEPHEAIVQSAQKTRSLNELLNGRILEKGRKLKIAAGDNYYLPVAMVAFTRLSFLMRRVFFRLMHRDLNAILDGLRELESRGVNTLDCRTAQFSAEEPTVRLRMICQSWKVMFHAEYSSGQPLRMLVDLHDVVDAALAESGGKRKKSGGRTRAKATSAGFGGAPTQTQEFEVSGGSESWNPNSGNNGVV